MNKELIMLKVNFEKAYEFEGGGDGGCLCGRRSF
jgi:hypothetical protein